MASKILVFAEGRDGKFKKGGLECLTEAQKIKGALGGGDVTAVVIGAPAMKAAAAGLGASGADRALVACADWLNNYNGDAYSRILVQAIKQESPRVAALLEVGLAADVTGLSVEGGKLSITRPVYAGKVYAQLELKTSPAIISVRPNTFPVAHGSAQAKVED